jgi:hypothetical protein
MRGVLNLSNPQVCLNKKFGFCHTKETWYVFIITINAVCSENHVEAVNTLCGQITVF